MTLTTKELKWLYEADSNSLIEGVVDFWSGLNETELFEIDEESRDCLLNYLMDEVDHSVLRHIAFDLR